MNLLALNFNSSFKEAWMEKLTCSIYTVLNVETPATITIVIALIFYVL